MRTLNEALQGQQGEDGAEDIEKKLYEALVYGTLASNSFPGENDDLGYFENIPEFQERIGEFRERIVKLILDLAANVDSSDELFNLGNLRDADPSEFQAFEPISNIIELLLENVDSYLDEARQNELGAGSGFASKVAASPSNTKGNSSGDGAGSSSSNKQVMMSKGELVREVRAGLHGVITHANIERPQLSFAVPVDNSRNPFRPKLDQKPHAVVPIPADGYALLEPQTLSSSSNAADLDDAEFLGHAQSIGLDLDRFQFARYPHPYEHEIQAALLTPPASVFEVAEPEPVLPLDGVPCTWVDTEEKLREMIKQLNGEGEIAVDLENHSYRSFQGFVCLMQISTREADFLVDTLVLRDQMHLLNEFFANPNVMKVLHGADFDVQWLQRDFGLYLVSLFDTGQAARVLEYPSAGLAHALHRHCQLRVNKAYQLADWRIRPLTEEMFKYAREDTHYLLYVYDKMRLELFGQGGKDAIIHVLKRSAEIALVPYEKEIFSPNSFKRLIKTKNLNLSVTQTHVLSAMYAWRDAIARREDESTQFVLPDRMLIRIAQDLPAVASELERCCNPLPPIVQTRVTEVLALVRSARDSSMEDDEDDEDDSEIKNLTTQKSSSSSNSTQSQPPLPPAAMASSVPGTVQIGLNSSKSTFVPINPSSGSSSAPQGKKSQVTFADAAKGSLKAGDRRGSILRDEANARATPSPVLTTDQLYDTAGWQDITDPNWKAAVIARSEMNLAANSPSESTAETSPKAMDVESENYKTALATKAKIGEEQLSNSGSAFGALTGRTPFAAMATAMSGMSNLNGTGERSGLGGSGGVLGNSVASADAITGVGPEGIPTVQEDTVIDIDTPADADALESEDIPRSMAEIYRISNRNRKRNKDKKKLKDDGGPSGKGGSRSGGGDNSGDEASQASSSHRKRSKDDEEMSDAVSGNDDAIEFMRGIGWVDPSTKPVATLLVEGAPVDPSHLAGATAESTSSEKGVSGFSVKGSSSVAAGAAGNMVSGSLSGKQQQGVGSQKTRGGRKVPSSPKRRPVNAGQGNNRQSQPQQQQQQKPAWSGGSGAAATRGASSSSSGGFSYSQAAASAANVRPGGGGQSVDRETGGNRKQGEGGRRQQQNSQQNTLYRGSGKASAVKYMSYSK